MKLEIKLTRAITLKNYYTYLPFLRLKHGALGVLLCAVAVVGFAQEKKGPISLSATGTLQYVVDSLGNQVPDFSYAGYQSGNDAIPEIPVKIVVPRKSGDATTRIQAAIDYVSGLPLDKNGFRGGVLLEAGEYEVAGSLKLHSSGVVLRGAGFDNEGTVLLGTGENRETLIRIVGKEDQQTQVKANVTSAYVPVNARKMTVDQPSQFNVGDQVMIKRPFTQEWINILGTDHFGGGITSLGWKPGRLELSWDRNVVSVDGNTIELDVPITTALDQQYGGATIEKYTWPGRIENVGVENMMLLSAYDTTNPKDEDHRWMGITIENAANSWVRRMQFKHFAGSAVYVLATAKQVTVEDCISVEPVSEIGGQRRYTFYTKGQQCLFQRLYSEKGYHDFAVGYLAAGPNAFVQCQAVEPYSFSGAIDSWASGILFDVIDIDAQALSYKNRGQDGQGAGWTAANSVFWQISAALVENYQPPTAQNWAFGVWAQFQGNGHWEQSNEFVKPRSLYYAQLKDRIGGMAVERTVLLPILTEASSRPPVSVAMKLSKQAYNLNPQLIDFIREAKTRQSLQISTSGLRTIDQVGYKEPVKHTAQGSMTVANGWLQRNQQVLVGKKTDIQWWSSTAKPHSIEKAKPHITRFVPGEMGLGLTDDLEEVAATMKANHVLSIDHNYGLWYDRRRDDHERVRRINGEVWPPFYELPFARTGTGLAYDGLSKYDLTKYNKFYWNRLKEFADLADQNGLILLHQNYFQHNILEAGAHYTDFPWRTANNVNEVGFPEPVPYAGDKRIFMAEQFYDVNHPARRALHRAYIRQCLDNFSDNASVIQLISAEYTGPLHFTQFWIDVIAEWKAETGKSSIIALSTPKDVQDAILADPKRAAAVDVIDIRYWHYQEDGSTHAPEGGKNLAPRQHGFGKKTSAKQVYRAVSEYRKAYPDKAVTYHGPNYPEMAWAIFMAGGSMANLPLVGDGEFYRAAATMKAESVQDHWILKGKDGGIVFQPKVHQLKTLFPELKGVYAVHYVDPKTGKLLGSERINVDKQPLSKKFNTSDLVIWISKK
ncbi:DUF6298 domain-containing protein [Sphingobacterium pedocola]|uniref:Pectate lyase n=1 Tax=Sphingobacterium pedocola TaxID=2082722 RepID=A0ABR9T9L4_9SPHI|nr:DUF6298 domain-containing protein [Sphingobacterium pedocola]MBE8721584.1 pectate lyase [Sphingobacterium pedocola]